MKETWKEIGDSDGFYEISSLGKVRSYYSRNHKNGITSRMKEPKILTWLYDRHGYPMVTIKINGKIKNKPIHRLVMIAFKGYGPTGFHCAHLDGNPKNPNLNNLKWVSKKENESHKKIHGTLLCGDRAPWSKITELCKKSILHKLSSGWKNKDIDQYYGLNPGFVSSFKWKLKSKV